MWADRTRGPFFWASTYSGAPRYPPMPSPTAARSPQDNDQSLTIEWIFSNDHVRFEPNRREHISSVYVMLLLLTRTYLGLPAAHAAACQPASAPPCQGSRKSPNRRTSSNAIRRRNQRFETNARLLTFTHTEGLQRAAAIPSHIASLFSWGCHGMTTHVWDRSKAHLNPATQVCRNTRPDT